ncbi:hypothetical protein GCM10022380_51470 [Amycolatopsis tucumanensis]|uniref:BetI-type transcriptional repressor C-terminal domain-containing protein n=1 Tax=Amycolatopsis tucumanensis TaxID=401106 RepID=A0ABP7ITC4_9PSEU
MDVAQAQRGEHGAEPRGLVVGVADGRGLLAASRLTDQALKDPEIAERFRLGHAQLRDAVSAMITAGQADGDLHADLDPIREADLLLALVTGLGDAVLLGHRTPAEVISLVDHHLSRLTP